VCACMCMHTGLVVQNQMCDRRDSILGKGELEQGKEGNNEVLRKAENTVFL